MAVGDRQKLAEAEKALRMNQSVGPDQTECKPHPLPPRRGGLSARERGTDHLLIDILCAVRASLRARVSALAEDNWMFEAEPQPRH